MNNKRRKSPELRWTITFLLLSIFASTAHAGVMQGTPLFKWEQVVPQGGVEKEFKLFCQVEGGNPRQIVTLPGGARLYQAKLGEVWKGKNTCWLDVVGMDGGFAGSNRLVFDCPECVTKLIWPRPVLSVE